MSIEEQSVPALCLLDEPGAGLLAMGPISITAGGAQRYLVRVYNGEKTIACALTREQFRKLAEFANTVK